MSAQLRKRKRQKDPHGWTETIKEPSSEENRLQQLLQSHFEANFAPLEVSAAGPRKEDSPESDDASDSAGDEWNGISDTESPETVEVVTYEAQDETDRLREKLERRSFMTSKPPTPKEGKISRSQLLKEASTTEDGNEAANIKNDMALQRLLQESSLLRNARTDAHGTMPSAVHPADDPTTASLTLRGTDRHKALDLRLQSLGAKDSLFKQRKMPLNHRLGIIEKQRTREKARRHEARENGIILEKATKDSTHPSRVRAKRDRGVGAPSVGRMKGGTLVLSQRDVRSIQGSDGVRGATSKRGRRK